MTSKEKAEELFYNFNKKGLFQISEIINSNIRKSIIKQCALIAVDEIINTDMLIDEDTYVETKSYLAYWQEVKKEINAL